MQTGETVLTAVVLNAHHAKMFQNAFELYALFKEGIMTNESTSR